MSVRLALLAALAAALTGSAAYADDEAPVATVRVQPKPAAPASAVAEDPVAQLEAIPGWGDAPPEPARPDRKVHGYVSAGIGSRGYRELSAGMTAPLGEDGYVALDVSSARIGTAKKK